VEEFREVQDRIEKARLDAKYGSIDLKKPEVLKGADLMKFEKYVDH